MVIYMSKKKNFLRDSIYYPYFFYYFFEKFFDKNVKTSYFKK